MSAIVSTSEASSLLKPDPPLECEHTADKDTTKEQGVTSGDCEEGIDKSGDILNYEHDEEEEDEDELEALRMAALQSRKPKKSDEPAYTLKQHPQRNNLTEIVLERQPPPVMQNQLPAVALPDTSRPPPGYTTLSLPPVVHGSAYGVVHLPPGPPPLTVPPPPPHPTHLPPPIYPEHPTHQPPPVLHHSHTYRPSEYYENRDKGYIQERDIRDTHSSYHNYRDRSREDRDSRARFSPGPYPRERYQTDKYYHNVSSDRYTRKNSPDQDGRTVPLQRISHDRVPRDRREKDKFSRYDSHSEEDESDNDPTLSGLESEEEVEEEVEVTATESEGEPEMEGQKEKVTVVEKDMGQKEIAEDTSKANTCNEGNQKEKQVTEADDVLNVHCTEEVDEFTCFLNEFEDELKDQPSKKTGEEKYKVKAPMDGENKENRNGETGSDRKKKTKIVKRIVKRPKKKTKSNENCSLDTTQTSQLTSDSSAIGKELSSSGAPDRRRTSPIARRWSPRSHTGGRSRSPQAYRSRGYSPRRGYASRSPTNSKSLPPSRVQENNRRSNSRGAVSQSKDTKKEDYHTDRSKETANEKEEREFQERLRRAETQEDRERMLARRKKFMNTSHPIEPTKKIVSLKSKVDHSIYDEPLNEKRMRRRSKEAREASERDVNEIKTEKLAEDTPEARLSKVTRLASEEMGDSISLGVEDTLDMFSEEDHVASKSPIKSKGNVTDLRVQLHKKRQQNKSGANITMRDRDIRDKLSNTDQQMDKSSSLSSFVVRRTVGNRKALRDERIDDDLDDSLDPLEKATLDDICPRAIMHQSDKLERGLSPKGKSRLVKDTRTGLTRSERKVEAFVTQNYDGGSDSVTKDSDEEHYTATESKLYGKRKTGQRSILDRLGEPVHNVRQHIESDTGQDMDQYSDSDSEFNTGRKEVAVETSSKSSKELKKEKRNKKEKKEKKKLKELKKLERKLKKLNAKKLLKAGKESGLTDSDASEAEEDYDDRIEYFIAEGNQGAQKSHPSQHTKESKTEKQKKYQASPKDTAKKKRSGSGDSRQTKNDLRKEEDSDDELFAFFEKEEGQISTATSTLGKKSDTNRKRKLSLRSSLATSEVTPKKKETHNHDKGVSPTHEVSLRSRINKKNEKIMKRVKEVQEDKLIHR